MAVLDHTGCWTSLLAPVKAAREPDAGDLAKMALMRTASAPEAPAPKPVAAQTSGLDWSGSIEAGPVLIRTRQDEVGDMFSPASQYSLFCSMLRCMRMCS